MGVGTADSAALQEKRATNPPNRKRYYLGEHLFFLLGLQLLEGSLEQEELALYSRNTCF